jgi:hypothetical protein
MPDVKTESTALHVFACQTMPEIPELLVIHLNFQPPPNFLLVVNMTKIVLFTTHARTANVLIPVLSGILAVEMRIVKW